MLSAVLGLTGGDIWLTGFSANAGAEYDDAGAFSVLSSVIWASISFFASSISFYNTTLLAVDLIKDEISSSALLFPRATTITFAVVI